VVVLSLRTAILCNFLLSSNQSARAPAFFCLPNDTRLLFLTSSAQIHAPKTEEKQETGQLPAGAADKDDLIMR
jgi:hypothetical protein